MTASVLKRTRPAGRLLLLAAAYVLLLVNWRAPLGLRLSVGVLNCVAFAAGVVGLPLAMFAVAGRLQHWGLRWSTRGMAGLLLLPGAFLGFLAGTNAVNGLASGGIDPSFERLHDVPVGAYHFAVYRWNGSATTDFEIVARQERVLVPGLRLVRDVEWFAKSDTATVVLLSPDSVRLVVPWHGSYHEGAEVRDYRLQSLLAGR
jgi:hypothetical protein